MNDQKSSSPTPFSEMTFNEGTIIFDEGDKGDSAYLIREGQVEIRKGTRSPDPQKLAILSKGDVLGELALFDGRPRMAGAIALTKVKAICISREEFLERLGTIDPSMKGIVLTMVSRVRKMADEFMRRKTEIEWAKWKKTE